MKKGLVILLGSLLLLLWNAPGRAVARLGESGRNETEQAPAGQRAKSFALLLLAQSGCTDGTEGGRPPVGGESCDGMAAAGHGSEDTVSSGAFAPAPEGERAPARQSHDPLQDKSGERKGGQTKSRPPESP